MPTISQKSLFDLVGNIYECAAEASEAGWLDVYGRIAGQLSSGPGSLNIVHKHEHRFEAIANTNAPGFFDDVNSTYLPIMPFREDLLNIRTGEVFMRRRDCPDETYVSSELYQDHFKKLGIYRLVHHCLFDDAATAAAITFTRPQSMKDFDKGEMAALAFLSPHLQRGMKLHLKIREANKQNRIALEAWDRIPQGVVVASRLGKIVFKNKAAERFVSRNGGLEIDRNGMLASGNRSDTRKLRELIRGVFSPDENPGSSFGGMMQLQRESESPPLSVLVTPFAEAENIGTDSEKLALVMITDPAQMSETLEADLRQIYGLTPSESRFAVLLAEGLSLIEAGGRLQITQNTARTHLKRIFGKTDTNRQGSLVKLVLGLPNVQRP